jgi:hypothetical protein
MIVTVDEVKAQLNQTLAIDDDLIMKKATAAQAHLESLLGFKMETEFPPAGDPPVTTVPADLKEAVLQLAAYWYEQRDGVIVGQTAQVLPFGIEDIVSNRRNYSWGCDE